MRLNAFGARCRQREGAAAAYGRAEGFTLLEVLIALLVLSVGLLGLAALQATTLEFNHSAYLRSQATALAYDMADRIRANRQAALDGAYDGVNFTDPPPTCSAPAGATVPEQDISAWRSALACALPQGNGRIERTNRLITISVAWDDSRGEADPEVFAMVTGL